MVVLKCHNDIFICLKFKLYVKCLINEKGSSLLRNLFAHVLCFIYFVLYLLLIVPVKKIPIENAVQSIFTTMELAVGSKT